MSSKFLYSSPSVDLTVLQDGTFNLNVATAKVSELTPNKPIKTDGENKLISGLIQPSDIAGGVIGNPLASNLNIGDYDITGLPFGQSLLGINSQQIFQTNVIDATESKTQNITSSTASITNMSGLLRIPEVSLERLSSTLQSSYIDMSEGGISITSGALNFNGSSIATSVDITGKLDKSGGTMTGGLIMGNQTLTDASSISLRSGTGFLKANGIVDNNTYAVAGSSSLVTSSVAFINASGSLSSNVSNLYVQNGVNTIQSAFDAISSGLGYSIQISSGSFTENLVLGGKQHIIISGVSCPINSPSTQINGSVQIGSSALQLSDRIKIKDLIITGNLTFYSGGLYQGLKTDISNCEIRGTLTLPAVANSMTWIYFYDCYFSQVANIVIPNQTNYQIVFTRCNFGQGITNNMTAGNAYLLTFRDCTNFTSLLNLGNCVLLGINSMNLGSSTVYADGLSLKGSVSSLIKGNGSSLSGTSSQIVLGDASLLSGTSTSLIRGNASLLSGTSTSLIKGDTSLLSGSSSQFVKADTSLDSTIYVPNPYNQVGSFRKWSKATGNITYTTGSTAVSIIPTVVAGSVGFQANEIQLGDVYTIYIAGLYTIPNGGKHPVINIGGLGGSGPFELYTPLWSSHTTAGTDYKFFLTQTITITNTGATLVAILQTRNDIYTPVAPTVSASYFLNSSALILGSSLSSSSLTITAIQVGGGSSTITPYTMYMVKN